VAVIPPDNSVARVLTDVDAVIVVAPGDREGFVRAVQRLLDDSAECEAMGSHGRKYAEEAFDVERVARRFEAIVAGVTTARK
jgi:colanic acid biosynthesis glycosyl transferase WcaI